MPYSQLIVTQNARPRKPIRFIRAAWKDTRALWKEFRSSIVLFLLVTVGVGFVYGELYEHARGIHIAWIDRPYLMLQLMILETPEPAPPEWYLVGFWYLLPVVFIYIIGRGAADFVRLFLNRDARRDAWREAVASTFRNHIIVFGAGHVGMRVIATMVNMGLEVVVIDNSPDPGVEEALSYLDAPLIMADGRLPTTLEKAGLPHADAFVACTGDDQVNLQAIMRARDLNPEIRIVARVWDNQFAKQIKNFMNVQSVLSSSDLSAPVFAGAALGIEITQTLNIGGIDYSMLRLTVAKGSFLDNMSIGSLQEKNEMDIVLHGTNDGVTIRPTHKSIVSAGDMLVIFARHEQIIDIVARNRQNSKHL